MSDQLNKVSDYFYQFTDLLFNLINKSGMVPHELFFLFSAYQRLLERLLEGCEDKLTKAQREYNKLQLDRFLEKVAGLGDEMIEQLPETFVVGTPLYVPEDLVEKWDPERMEGEVRIEAVKWLNSGAKKVIGKPTVWADVTMDTRLESVGMVQNLYEKGAERVEVIDPPAGGNEGVASIIRVTLPWDPTEVVASDEAPLADKALATLAYISELGAHSMKQDPEVENAFYISWIEEE